jgi:two-component system phosphate regulon response regulator PhoB
VAKLLIVDDDPAIRELLVTALGTDHKVTEAGDGAAAMGLVDGTFDAVILDVMMPNLDGFEVLRRIRQASATAHLPVVMLTAKVAEDDYLRGFRSGADAYVAKPFDIQELENTLDKVMGLSREQRAANREAEAARARLLRHLDNRFD